MPDDLVRLRQEYLDREKRVSNDEKYSMFNSAALYMIQQRERAVLKLLRRQGITSLQEKRILEIGCGAGGVLLEYIQNGATPTLISGSDLLSFRLESARSRLAGVGLTCADAQHLPYRSQQFDLVLQYTVLSSILDDSIKANIAAEMLRMVRKPDGLILWYDFWLNPSNPQTKGIRPQEIRRLFPGCQFEFRRVTLAPPVTRLLIRGSWLLCEVIESLRLLNSHYLVVIRPPAR